MYRNIFETMKKLDFSPLDVLRVHGSTAPNPDAFIQNEYAVAVKVNWM
jgi:hypothetical protein